MPTNAEKEVLLSTADTAIVLQSQQDLKALVKKIETVLDGVKAEINRIAAANKESLKKTGKTVQEINLAGSQWTGIIFGIVGKKEQGLAQKLSTAQSTVIDSPDFNYSDKLQKLMRYIGDEHRFLLDLLHKVQLEFTGKRPITEASAVLDGLRDLCALIKTRIKQVEDSFK